MADHKPRIIDRSVYVLVVLMLASFNLSLLTSIVALVQFFMHFGLNLAMLISAAFQLLEMIFDVALFWVVVRRSFSLGWDTLRQEIRDLLGHAAKLHQSISSVAAPARPDR